MNHMDTVIYKNKNSNLDGQECTFLADAEFCSMHDGKWHRRYILWHRGNTVYAKPDEVERLPHPDKAGDWNESVWRPEHAVK